jgi:glutaminyl-tRNA synthetase
VKGTLHWVSAAHALPCEVRLYDRLLLVPDPDALGDDTDWKTHLNPESLVLVKDALVEPSVRDSPAGSRYQFERLGYFFSDPVDARPDALVFNRTVALRDTWARLSGTAQQDASRPQRGRAPQTPDRTPRPKRAPTQPAARTQEEEKRYHLLVARDLPAEQAGILARDEALGRLFDTAVTAGAPPRAAANWIVNELPRELGGSDTWQLAFDGGALARLVALVEDGTLSSSGGREVLGILVRDGGDPDAIVERNGLRQVSDDSALDPIVAAVLAAHADRVEAYRGGRTGLLGFFVGQVMSRSGGRANPERVTEILTERLG